MTPKADRHQKGSKVGRQLCKRLKSRFERREAKKDVYHNGYGRYGGYYSDLWY